jgi:hypothetical protein
MQACRQMELPLFAPPAFNEVLSRQRIDNIDVCFNERLKRSWRVRINAFSGRRTLTIPSHFEDAPEQIKEAFIEWAMLTPTLKQRGNAASRQRKRRLEHMIWEYAESSGKKTHSARRVSPNSFQSTGRLYDLREVFDSVNARYFSGKLTSYVRWNKSRLRSYQTAFVDTEGQRHNLISIARVYNGPDVPRFAVEAIMYHEMLHIAIPPYKRDYHNIIHGPEFRRAEQSFPHFKDWRKWEKKRLGTRME